MYVRILIQVVECSKDVDYVSIIKLNLKNKKIKNKKK